MSNSTAIKVKRTTSTGVIEDTNLTLQFGEPLLINSAPENYLVLGPKTSPDSTIGNSIFFRGMTKSQAANALTYNSSNVITNLSDVPLKVSSVSSEQKGDGTPASGKYYIVCEDTNGKLFHFDFNDAGIYITENGVMHGAAWNDYAEGRDYEDDVAIENLAGHVVCEDGHGKLKLSREKLQPCSYVVSDTFGTSIGTGNINVAIAGKALVYVADEVEVGDCVTAGFNGKAVKMTRNEIINYPDRILGTVVEIPDYDTYGNIYPVDVDGRVWIRIR